MVGRPVIIYIRGLVNQVWMFVVITIAELVPLRSVQLFRFLLVFALCGHFILFFVFKPTLQPIIKHTRKPFTNSTMRPSSRPTAHPTLGPPPFPTSAPTSDPAFRPTHKPTPQPFCQSNYSTTLTSDIPSPSHSLLRVSF
jgi:hypothetical protein